MLKRIRLRMLRRFRKEERGLAAVEFALILPVLVTLLFGVGELSMAVGARSSVSQVASTVGDLVAQASAPNAADIGNVYAAANTILFPYFPVLSSEAPAIRITSVIFDPASRSATVGRVAWTCSQAGSGTLVPASRAKGSTVTFDQPLLSDGGSVLVAEVAFAYTTPTIKAIRGSYVMRDSFHAKPRRVAQIPEPAGCS